MVVISRPNTTGDSAKNHFLVEDFVETFRKLGYSFNVVSIGVLPVVFTDYKLAESRYEATIYEATITIDIKGFVSNK